MAEIIKCPNPKCNQYINLEINIYRDTQGNIYCSKCHALINNN